MYFLWILWDCCVKIFLIPHHPVVRLVENAHGIKFSHVNKLIPTVRQPFVCNYLSHCHEDTVIDRKCVESFIILWLFILLKVYVEITRVMEGIYTRNWIERRYGIPAKCWRYPVSRRGSYYWSRPQICQAARPDRTVSFLFNNTYFFLRFVLFDVFTKWCVKD